METSGEAVYCLACFSGQEQKAEVFIKKCGYKVISASVERTVVKQGEHRKELRSLLPGYVFLASKEQPFWDELIRFRYIIQPLRYGDGSMRLRGEDLEFVRWLQRHNGVIETSKAVEEGTKIRIVSGPLAEYEGKIVKVNKRRRCAAVRIESERITCTVWCSFDLVEETR
jgi:transcription antitermination factor NusG